MTSPSLDAQMTKIGAMLAKAENEAATPAEAQAYTAMAAKLIAKYGIEAALLDAHRSANDPTHKPQQVLHRRYEEFAPYSMEKATLLYRIFSELRCKCIISRKGNDTVVHVFGFESDLRRAQMLYVSLDVQVEVALAQALPHRPSFEPTQTWIKSFRNGFANAIATRLEESEREAVTDSGSSTDLVIVDRNRQVQSALNSEFPGQITKYAKSSGFGAASGFTAGKRANIGTAVSGRNNTLGS